MQPNQTKNQFSKKFIFLFLILLAIFLISTVYKNKSPEKKNTLDNTTTVQEKGNEEENKLCAKAGERSISNFDMTTGKTDPSIEPLNCCSGLTNIADKQTDVALLSQGACAFFEGINYSLCSPCGNGKCDSEYEDICNCPEDCK